MWTWQLKQIPKILNHSTTTNNSTGSSDEYHPISFFVDYSNLYSDKSATKAEDVLKESFD